VVNVPGYRSRGPGFDSRRYQIFWEVVGLERGPLSPVRIIEELLERKVAAPVYKTEINGRGDSLRWPRDTLYPLKLALTSPTSGGHSVGIVRWRTKAPEFFLQFSFIWRVCKEIYKNAPSIFGMSVRLYWPSELLDAVIMLCRHLHGLGLWPVWFTRKLSAASHLRHLPLIFTWRSVFSSSILPRLHAISTTVLNYR
jgi:hypothetical protein